MRLAQITKNNGIDYVHWIFDADEIPQFAPPCDRIFEVGDEVSEGWLWNDGDPIPTPYVQPEPIITDIEEARAAKRAELMHVRDQVMAEGFRHSEHVYPMSQDVQLSLMQEFMGSQLMPAPVYMWKDITGEYRLIGEVQAFQGFCLAAMMYGKSLFAREAMLQELVRLADTVEDVVTVTWDTVPDGPV